MLSRPKRGQDFLDKASGEVRMDYVPDFVKLAEASECYGIKVERPSEIREALNNAVKANKDNIPAVVDVTIQHDPTWGMWGAWGSGFPSSRPRPRVL